MDKLTNMEKKIVFMLTKIFSKSKLEKEFLEWEEGGMVDEIIDSVRSCYKLLSINPSSGIDIQYLNYVLKHYESVKNKNFNNPIERVENYDYLVPGIEIETVSVDYRISFNTLPSMVSEKLYDVKEHFWEYDPEREVNDYLESEIDDLDFTNADISPNKYGRNRNVIE